MREIKFRAWDTRERIMSYGRKPYMYLTNTERLIGIGCDLHHSMYHDTSRSFEKEIVLMQYTGLKDKNGRDIYEGDIVQTISKHKAVIIYEENNECGGRYSPVFYDVDGYSWWKKERWSDLTIIGNRYENPGLLEAK